MMTPDERRAKRDEAARQRATWRPTPTQEENDLKALGVPVDEIKKEPNGSPPDPATESNRAMWPRRNPKGGYETR
jgi:hypothetical protein